MRLGGEYWAHERRSCAQDRAEGGREEPMSKLWAVAMMISGGLFSGGELLEAPANIGERKEEP
jgi:hypothetical protein